MEFRDKIKKYKEEGKVIVFTDESGFVESAPRTHGYSIKGKRCYGIHDWHPSNRTNVIGALMEKSLLTVSIFNCNINGAVFNCWVEQDLIPKLPANSGQCSFPEKRRFKNHNREIRTYNRVFTTLLS